MRVPKIFIVLVMIASTVATIEVAGAGGRPDDGPAGDADAVFDYWNSERVASAQPRDFVIDHRGLGYLRGASGSLSPYGHGVAAVAPRLQSVTVNGAQPAPSAVGASTQLAASIGSMSPDGATVGANATFTAVVTADAAIRSVQMYVGRVGSTEQRFSMSFVGNDTWQANLQGFSDGSWEWYIVVSERKGVKTTSSTASFTVSTGGGVGGVVANQRWTDGGAVQTAAGRILFTMPGGNYVCSGTAVTDGTTGRSIILTAAHCVYDDVAKEFSSNALFIPSQDDGGTDGTDFDCTNDTLGCWSVDHGVVDLNWTTRTFPDNIPWDYGYYAVSDSGAHQGSAPSPALDVAAGSLQVDFASPVVGDSTTALGYSYSDDPYFMYCQEAMATSGSANYWLDSCDLSGGASGGPWMQPLSGGNGQVISVNSWGYTTGSGMAGPKLNGTSAQMLFDAAKGTDLASADRGFVIDPANPPTTTSTTSTTSSTSSTSTTSTTSSTSTTSTPSTTTTVPLDFSLSVNAYKEKGAKIGVLTWSGATGGQVDIVRDGAVVATTANDEFETDFTGQKGGGSTTWQICEVGSTSACSNEWTHIW